MGLNRELRRLLAGMLAAFLIVALAAAYWGVIERDRLLAREDNPRLLEARGAIVRGSIYDRHGEPLAVSEPTETRFNARHYLHEEAYSAIGYASLRYGTAGVEALFDETLNGDDRERTFAELLLGSPQVGSDLQITLDMEVQRTAANALQGLHGAIIVLSVPDGQVLALLSLPTYDPNTLDDDWERLLTDEGNPFFNRALQGLYQPGSALQTPLMIKLLLNGQAVDQEFDAATAPVALHDLTLGCSVRLPVQALTLRDAYAFGCPAPFAQLAEGDSPGFVNEAIDMMRTLEDYSLEPSTADGDGLDVLPPPANDTVLDNVLGQGQLTVNPLSMALLTAAIVNDGNAPQPQILLATHAPDATWARYVPNAPSIPLMTQTNARRLQDLMRNAIANGAALNAGRPSIDMGGHAAVAYAGDDALAWFVGFSTLGGRRGVVTAVVIEQSADASLAADIGGTTLLAAQSALGAENGALTPFPQTGS
ncbi:MAG: hypothetical protein IT320_09130 [Anaerolineae bacterium]|nr:hypothetical protein [Anaerolineae bacterium]